MLCSVMICSYKRPKRLFLAIESLKAHAACPQNIEFLLRFSDADPESIAMTREFESLGNVRVFTGPHRRGYVDLGLAFTEIAPFCVGKWCSIWDDDMVIDGPPWDLALENIEQPAFVVCEKYTLHCSEYGPGSCNDGIGWIIPPRCWEQYGYEAIGDPPDNWMKRLLVDKHGWPLKWLEGVTLKHDWQRPTDGDR